MLFSVLVVGVTRAFLAPGAEAQNQARVGDLVEIVTGLGPTLAEVVTGPDPSGYVVIRVPTGKEMPVNTQKLRLVQRAGTPTRRCRRQSVSWVDGNIREQGRVAKVNGKWCQVTTANATTVGWVECADLRTSGAATRSSSPASTAAAASGSAPLPKLLGNWENADGSVTLEFQSAGQCVISVGPVAGPCSYTPAATGVTVSFEGEQLPLAANSDGSLSSAGDAATTMIRLKLDGSIASRAIFQAAGAMRRALVSVAYHPIVRPSACARAALTHVHRSPA
jgi:hypothetical protein